MAYEVTLVIYTENCPILISNIFFSQIQIRHFFQPKSIDFLSLNKTYSVGTYEKRLDEALLMSINNTCFRWKIRKIISGYFSYLRLSLLISDGRCIDEGIGFKCHCEPGFSGTYCEVNDDDCIHNPCLNGGACLDGVNEFVCRCVPGFVGELCEDNVDDCQLRPCANGGACKDLVNDFECTCRPGFTGKFCTIDIDECASSPCRNGGKCTQSVDEYSCACPTGFSGKNCQYLPGQPHETSTASSETTQHDTTSKPTNKPDTLKPNNSVSVTEHQNGDMLTDELTTTQLLLIVCLGVGIPLLAIIIAVTILLCRKRRSRDSPTKEEEENQQNSINNKLSNIFTTIPQSSSTLSNLTSKISNEEQDFNTLKSNRSSRPISQIYIGEKPLNKQLFYTTDLQVHSQHRDFEKTTKKLEKEGLKTIDPSNLDVR